MILVVDMNWKKDSLGYFETVAPLVALVEEFEEATVRHYKELKAEDLAASSKSILSGTTLKDTAFLEDPTKFVCLKDTNKPVLGICAGMEAIGIAFGLQLKQILEIGMTQITTLRINPLFSGTFKAYSLHNYAVEPATNFEALAESAKCVQAIKHKNKPIYGILFHPEVRNIEIIKQFIKMQH